MSEWEQQSQADARLAILAGLAEQRDGTANSIMLQRVLDAMGFRRSREWTETQLARLEELGAVNTKTGGIASVGNLTVATITRAGREHLERRALIVGISVPADEV